MALGLSSQPTATSWPCGDTQPLCPTVTEERSSSRLSCGVRSRSGVITAQSEGPAPHQQRVELGTRGVQGPGWAGPLLKWPCPGLCPEKCEGCSRPRCPQKAAVQRQPQGPQPGALEETALNHQ